MMHAGYSQANVWGWAVLNPSRTNAQTQDYHGYNQAAIGGSLSCQLSRDKDSLALYSISLSDSTWLQADVDIGGATVRWRYKDFGTQFHDQCMELASQAGASMTTPDTLGITWPSGTSYWIPSMMLCDLKSFMSASQSGTANSYDSGSGYTRSTSTVSCLAAFIEAELPPAPNYGQTPVTSIVISDGSYERPFCSWSSQCTWNAATQAVCAQKLCERSGYSTGSFVSSTGNMCSDDAGLSGHYWTTDSASFTSGSPGVEAGITAECSSE